VYQAVRGFSRATVPQREKIAEALGTSVDVLFDGARDSAMREIKKRRSPVAAGKRRKSFPAANREKGRFSYGKYNPKTLVRQSRKDRCSNSAARR
jgi:hypothetical protein